MEFDRHPRWPNRGLSRFVISRPHKWHVQSGGAGRRVLLIHGAGGSSHSWRDVLPLLTANHHVMAVDLPGHGFTRLGARFRSGLPAMATDLAALLDQEDFAPDIIVGHSAGAAVALRLALDRPDPARAVLGINPALGDFPGLAGWLFPMMAKLLAVNPLTALAVSRLGAAGSARRLIDGTGSQIDEAGLAQYGALISDRRHVDGALQMMSQWSLSRLREDLPKLDARVLLIAGSNDRTVPPETATEAARHMPDAAVEIWVDLGHLLHEEAPARIAERITAHLTAPN